MMNTEHKAGHEPYVPAFVSGILLVVALIIGIYVYGLTVARDIAETELKRLMAESQQQQTSVQTASGSDEVDAIERDLKSTDIEGSDSGMAEVEAAF